MYIELENTGIMEFFTKFWIVVIGSSDYDCTRLMLAITVICIAYAIWGNQWEKRFMGWQNIILIFIIFCPLTMHVLTKSISFNQRYFRYLWIVPFPLVFGYTVNKYTEKLQNVIDKEIRKKVNLYYVFSALLFIGIVCFSIHNTGKVYTLGYKNQGMNLVDNVYKVEEDTLEAADLIEEDKGDTSQMAKVLYSYDFYIDLRNYDPSLSYFSYVTSMKDYTTSLLSAQDLLDTYNSGDINLTLYMIVSTAGMGDGETFPFTKEQVNQMLQTNEVEYAIVPKNNGLGKWFTECGKKLGETPHFTVYKVEY